MSTTSVILEGVILDYYRAHAYREPMILAELRARTAAFGDDAIMQIAPEQGAFMGMIAQLMGARRISRSAPSRVIPLWRWRLPAMPRSPPSM